MNTPLREPPFLRARPHGKFTIENLQFSISAVGGRFLASTRGNQFGLGAFKTARWLVLAASLAGLVSFPVRAFPPAPHHVIYGLVRDEMGNPIAVTNAQVMLETSAGIQIQGLIVPNLEPGVNYRLYVPVDAGTVSDLYKPTALRPTVPFRMKVLLRGVTYLPIRLSGTNLMAGASFSSLGKPAERTRLDLTLGVDANGDGLPDAWQQALIDMLGPDAKTGPNDDADGDGISNLDEYLAGTYAFDPTDGFRLNLVPQAGAPPLLEFMVIGPRTYTVLASTNLQTWTPLEFKIPANGPSAPTLPNYPAMDVRILRVEPVLPADLPAVRYFYKVQVQ